MRSELTSRPLEQLVYELLDAHDDTARLVDEVADADAWERHLDYLRRLQRVGRELLACGVAAASLAR
ncbi:MAG: hypothetical protein JO027_17465 [Solirubrobacterales bacterium]|nr:hypothetical protein [Solirubrobacterales bacterium]